MSIKEDVGTLRRLVGAFDKGSLVLLAGTAILLVVALTRYCCTAMTLPTFGWWIAGIEVFLIGSFVRPILTMMRKGYESVLSVCIVVTSIFALSLIGFYTSCYFIVGNLSADGSPVSKLLDLPTPLVAVWAAGLGWYITFQSGKRSQRTSHAVSLVLSTRTNAEFLKHSQLVRKRLPTKDDVDAIEDSLYSFTALKETAISRDEKDETKVKRYKDAQGIAALKYMLNYYEFVAVGIEAGDIDEQMTYEALGEHVIKLFDRGESVCRWLRDPQRGNEQLAWCHLEKLVNRWRAFSREDHAERVRSAGTS